uniref:DNA helicase MCM8 n=1 Tax=Dendroctonus ponderosae TaxID=77166 RepID=A0AAR5Q6U8_DENPD
MAEHISGMDLYFFGISASNRDNIIENVKRFGSHIERNGILYPWHQIEKDHYFTVDFKTALDDNLLMIAWSSFRDDLIANTEFTLNCMGLAMYQYISRLYKASTQNTEIGKTLPVIRARILNHEPLLPMKDINVSSFGKLVSLRGTVVKAGPVKIVCTHMAFQCPGCGSVQVEKQINGTYIPLQKCTKCGAKQNVEPLYNSPLSKTVESQNIVLQEIDCDVARVPQTIECELTEDLVKCCLPGDVATISGVIKVLDPNDNKRKNKQNSIFNLYLHTVAVYNNSNGKSCSTTSSHQRISFTHDDYLAIKEIHGQPQLFRYLVQSLCPLIYGHEIVKAGLLLGLFRGTKGDCIRSESHVLMVGDPGLGKSQMLKSCANVSPRGVYVCGNVSTTSGLTVTMTRESGGEHSLEAGALMIADQGCCCIDEFDKLPAQHACLLEAMEQQCISIAKAGVVCSLPTKPTILVAANPSGGHYDQGKTLEQNLKLSSPLLSRFDLIFLLLDRPNQNIDKYLSKHILTSHSSTSKHETLQEYREQTTNDFSQSKQKLSERLKLNGETLNYLSHKTFRKYIAYAQKYVEPRLSQEAKYVLTEFYVTLRKQFATGDCTPVTARQLYSLIRLTEARAKAELREEATIDDAKDVIEIVQHSVTDVFTNEAGVLDTTRSEMGTRMSYKKQVMKLVEILQKKSQRESTSLFTIQQIREEAQRECILKDKFSDALHSLNVQGYLLCKGKNSYQLNSAYL